MKLIAAALLPLFAVLPALAAEFGVSVRLSDVRGAVSARASSAAQWTPVKDGVMLAAGGEVRTEAGASAVLAFSDGNKVRLGQKTTFGVEGATTLKTSLRLFSGRLQAWVKRSNRADFVVRHAVGVAAVRGTVFTMTGGVSDLTIDLFEGSLDIIDNFGLLSSMTPGQNARLSQDMGLKGIASLPPETKTPEEPKAEIPEPPKTDAASDAAAPEETKAEEILPEEQKTEETKVEDALTESPQQEKETSPVSPSAP